MVAVKRFLLGGACVLLIGLSACRSEKPELLATIEGLNATISAQDEAIATLEVEANQPTASPRPSPRTTPTQVPGISLPSPLPVATVQRPPTATPSYTPSSTPTATPTATAIPDASVGQSLTNIRDGPAVGFPILAEAAPGTPLTILGKTADGEWFKVRLADGLEGWMFHLPIIFNIPLDSVPVTE